MSNHLNKGIDPKSFQCRSLPTADTGQHPSGLSTVCPSLLIQILIPCLFAHLLQRIEVDKITIADDDDDDGDDGVSDVVNDRSKVLIQSSVHILETSTQDETSAYHRLRCLFLGPGFR